MRLFIGIGLPPTLSEALSQAARTLIAQPKQNITFTRPENMHVTISFLGQVDPSRLNNIQQSLADLNAAPLSLHLDGVGTFPNAGILFAAIKPTPSLLNFAEHVTQSMESCGFPREQRPYHPHITLARIKARINLPRGADHPAFHKTFLAHEFRLYESFTKPQGAQYEVRTAFPLSQAT
jgi:2'-5' RNA ligase